jgi:hypothetical protein
MHRGFRSVPATHQTWRRFAAGSSSVAASAAGEAFAPTPDETIVSAGFFFLTTTPAIDFVRCATSLGADVALPRPRVEARARWRQPGEK